MTEEKLLKPWEALKAVYEGQAVEFRVESGDWQRMTVSTLVTAADVVDTVYRLRPTKKWRPVAPDGLVFTNNGVYFSVDRFKATGKDATVYDGLLRYMRAGKFEINEEARTATLTIPIEEDV